MGATAGACLRSGYALLAPCTRRPVSSSLTLNLILFVAQHFGYGWNPQSFGGVRSDTILTGATNSLFMFFRVTSGSASVSQMIADAPTDPAPVPLPAAGFLMMAGLGALSILRKRQKAS